MGGGSRSTELAWNVFGCGNQEEETSFGVSGGFVRVGKLFLYG